MTMHIFDPCKPFHRRMSEAHYDNFFSVYGMSPASRGLKRISMFRLAPAELL